MCHCVIHEGDLSTDAVTPPETPSFFPSAGIAAVGEPSCSFISRTIGAEEEW